MREPREMTSGWLSRIAEMQDRKSYAELHWEGSFEDYLEIVRKNPKVTRTAFQRIYDMILQPREDRVHRQQEEAHPLPLLHRRAASAAGTPSSASTSPLMKLVNVFKSAAQGYGTEKRVILLHGPVGSSKSTIARLLKKGIEEYSKTPEGAAYTFAWDLERKGGRTATGQRKE